MLLNLTDLLDRPGGRLAFSFSLDLSDMSFSFGCPFPEPVFVSGTVENHAGALSLSAEIQGTLALTCDRCAEPYTQEKTLSVFFLLTDRPAGDDLPDEMLPIVNGLVHLEEPFVTQWILDLGLKHLCSEDCPGLCPQCGKNFRDGPCGCMEPPVDPRLQKLSEFFSR